MTNINKLDVNELKLSVANGDTINKDTKCLKEDVMLFLEILTKEVVKNQDFLCPNIRYFHQFYLNKLKINP